MPVVVVLLAMIGILALVWHFNRRVPRLPGEIGGWGDAVNQDPRVALAAMMVLVASHGSSLTPESEASILAELRRRLDLDEAMAARCLASGRRLARVPKGDLNSCLHALAGPIRRQCSPDEKQDAVDMLQQIAGIRAQQFGAVREALGRITSTLLRG